jgi:hypothetical protein
MNVLEYNGSVICKYNLISYDILCKWVDTLWNNSDTLWNRSDPCDLRLHVTTRGRFCQEGGDFFP